MFISNEEILIVLILIIIIYLLLCYNAEPMTVSDKKLSARLDDQGIMQLPNVSGEKEFCCGEKEFCCGKKEPFNTPLDGLTSYDKAEEIIVDANLRKNSFYETMVAKSSRSIISENKRQLIKLKNELDYLQKNNRNYINNNKISKLIARIFALNKQNDELTKTENCCGSKQERFGSNPLDSLTSVDMSSAPFSDSEMEPMVNSVIQENFEERYISDNRESNKGEQYIPNPENSFIIG